jgi:alcohol dehydrogenase class IV
MTESFTFARIPRIEFGAGKFALLPLLASSFGKKALIITGGSSLKKSGRLDMLAEGLKSRNIVIEHTGISGEPSPEFVDNVVCEYQDKCIDMVIGIGGGSAIDAGKAVSAMLLALGSVEEYLEGVGTKQHPGLKIPFIAVPTTAGTGSEATKNAVLSKIGTTGYKKSLRHDNFVPDVAVVDPELMLTCPVSVSASCGMDAFVQLFESYVSVKSSPMTDALALSGMKAAEKSLVRVCSDGGSDIGARSDIAYASLMSGITLANAGLGVIHGFASAIGGFFDIPHGVICGTLLAAATRKNIAVLKNTNAAEYQLEKHARIGALLSGEPFGKNKTDELCSMLTDILDDWTQKLSMPRLSEYGVRLSDADRIVDATEPKNNAVKLCLEDIRDILIERI